MSYNTKINRTFVSLATLGVIAIVPLIGSAPAFAAPTSASKISTVTSQKNLTTNSTMPFGNGSGNQNYKYADSIKTFDFKVYGAAANAKVEVKKWNWNSSKWETHKTYSPASTGSGFLAYKLIIPKSTEGKTEVFKAQISATATTPAWDSKMVYIGTHSRASVNFPSTMKPFGNMKEVKVSSSGIAVQSWSGISKESGDFYVQELQKGKWVNVLKASKVKTSSGTWNVKYSAPFRKAGTTSTYRLYHYANNSAKAWNSASQNLVYKLNPTDFYEKSGSLWNGVHKRWVVNTNDKLTNVQVMNGAGRTIYLQKYDSKKKSWSNVSSSKLNNGNYAKGTLTVPKMSTQGSVSYRAYIPANKYYASDTSGKFSVKYEDPRKYTGYKKSIYSNVKKYCPNLLIDTAKKNGKWYGLAFWGEERIMVVTGLTSSELKFVSLHECAHLRQMKVYSKDRNGLVKSSNKIYGKNGLEQMADCMAVKMGAGTKHYGYTNNCKGARGLAAAKVLSGKRL